MKYALCAILVMLAACDKPPEKVAIEIHASPVRRALTDVERNADHRHPLKVELTTGDIILRIVPQEQFDAQINHGHPSRDAKGNPINNTANAFTTWLDWNGSDPCVITMAAGHLINVVPSEGDATWRDSEDFDTLPHEITHCLRGAWHPDWDTAIANQKKRHEADEAAFRKEYKIAESKISISINDNISHVTINGGIHALDVEKDGSIVCFIITKQQYDDALTDGTMAGMFRVLWNAGHCQMRIAP